MSISNDTLNLFLLDELVGLTSIRDIEILQLETLKILSRLLEGKRVSLYVFDGKNIDSAVNIRFIEQSGENGLQFRSGGGVTANSEPHNEYNEMLNKVYVPVG